VEDALSVDRRRDQLFDKSGIVEVAGAVDVPVVRVVCVGMVYRIHANRTKLLASTTLICSYQILQ